MIEQILIIIDFFYFHSFCISIVPNNKMGHPMKNADVRILKAVHNFSMSGDSYLLFNGRYEYGII